MGHPRDRHPGASRFHGLPIVLITFSGLDGAGKSTLIGFVEQELARAHRGAVVLHMNERVGIHAYLRMLRDRAGAVSPNPAPSQWAAVAHAPPAAPATRAARLRARLIRVRNAVVWSRTLRACLYPIDLVVFLAYRLYVEGLRRRVLIMDRYFYDTLVDVLDRRTWRAARLLERLTPTPDLAIYLDVEPEVAFARKGEYSVEYLRQRRDRYRHVFTWIRRHVALPVGELPAMRDALRGLVAQRVPLP